MRRLLVILVCASTTAAQAGRVVPMLPVIKPVPAPELREKFQEAVARGLGQDPGIVSGAEVRGRLTSAPDLLDCVGGPCLPRVATVLRADRMVVTEIAQSGKTYEIKVHVFDADGRELGKAVSETCDICTVREADEAVQKAAARAAPMVASIEPRTPPPSRIEEGPEAPRLTPAITEPAPQPRPPAVAQGSEAPPPPAETAVPEKKDEGSGFPYRPVAIGAFALAGVALATTIGFGVYASRDGNGSCSVTNPAFHDPRCMDIYSGNTAPAAFFGVLTVLSAGTGVLLLYLDSRRARSTPAVTAVPTRDGFAAAASFEF